MSLLSTIASIVLPKPTIAELTERLRTAKAEAAEAKKVTPQALSSLHGLPETRLVDASIECCRAAMKERDAELAFRQGDTESDAIHATLAETLDTKAREAGKLQAAVKAAQDALDTFRAGIDADVERTTGLLRELNAKRSADDLPRSKDLPRDNMRSNLDLPSLLWNLDLSGAAELLRRPVLGRGPNEGDLLQSRINEIQRGDRDRETKRAIKAMPPWDDRDEWVSKWLAATRAERNELETRGYEMRAKASGRSWG